MIGKDFAGEFTFALPIHTGKHVHAISWQSRIGIAAKTDSSIISTVAPIDNDGDAEPACMRLTVAVRIHDLPARRRTILSAVGLTTRSVVRGPGFVTFRQTTRIYRKLLHDVRSGSVLLKPRSADNDGPVRTIAFGYDGNRPATTALC